MLTIFKFVAILSLFCFAWAGIHLHSKTLYSSPTPTLDFDTLATKSNSMFGVTGYVQYLIELNDQQMKNLHTKKSNFPFELDTTKFVPPNAFVVFSSVEDLMTLKSHHYNIHGRVPSEAKMYPQRIETSVYDVLLYKDCDNKCLETFKAHLARHWIYNVIKISSRRIRIDFGWMSHGQIINQIKEEDIVEWIHPVDKIVLSNLAGNIVTQQGHPYNASLAEPSLWERGLTGSGEIVAVADTGLDYDMCWFSEADKTPPPINSFDSKRRKVVGFYQVTPAARVGDYVGGHGTHVASSVAGSILNPATEEQRILNRYRGGAPDAKLAIMSIGKAQGNIIEGDGGIIIPTNITDIYKTAETGAKIFTNSWGANMPTFYSAWDRDIDQYIYNNDETLTLFAAGNSQIQYSVGSPGSAKNVLTVGATETTTDGVLAAVTRFDVAQAQACCASERGQRICCPSWLKDNSPLFHPNNKAFFSSEGNTFDERSKPEISAPGHIIVGAHSDANLNSFQCENIQPNGANRAALMSMSGTSMATPLLAGNAALVRQYFREGWFVNGRSGSPQGFIPSGSLVKAAIIHSGRGKGSEVFPNPRLGHGRAALMSALKFHDSNFNLTFQNRRQISNGQVHNYMFTAVDNGEFRATISWYDAPVSLLSRVKLVNSLMLDVWVNGFHYNANGLDYDSPDNSRRVAVDTVLAGSEIFVRVTAKRVITASQPYSIIMTGNTEETTISRSCNAIDIKDPQSCNGNGFCSKLGTCICKGGFSGTECTEFSCFGKAPGASDVCGGRGKCVSGNKCECTNYNQYGGIQCDVPVCFGALKTQPFSCGRAGTCMGPDTCQCNNAGTNKNCEVDIEEGLVLLAGILSIGGTLLICCCVSICFCICFGVWACFCRSKQLMAPKTHTSENTDIVQPLTAEYYQQ